MRSPSSSASRLRLTATLVGLAGGLVLLRLAARLSNPLPAVPPASWLDRLTLVLEPLIGVFGVVAALGLWNYRRWGGLALTVWIILVAGQVSLVALLVVALSGLAWRPVLVWVGLLGGVLFASYRLVRAVWRWLAPAA